MNFKLHVQHSHPLCRLISFKSGLPLINMHNNTYNNSHKIQISDVTLNFEIGGRLQHINKIFFNDTKNFGTVKKYDTSCIQKLLEKQHKSLNKRQYMYFFQMLNRNKNDYLFNLQQYLLQNSLQFN